MKGAVSSELDHILRLRREASEGNNSVGDQHREPPPPPPPPPPPRPASSEKSFSRKSLWSPLSHTSPQQKFNDIFNTQPFEALDFNISTSEALTDWDWGEQLPTNHNNIINNNSLSNELEFKFATDFDGGAVGFDKTPSGRLSSEDSYEEVILPDQSESLNFETTVQQDKHFNDTTAAEFALRTFPILGETNTKWTSASGKLSQQTTPLIHALAHPYNANIIVCRSRPRYHRGKSVVEWFLDEIDPTCNLGSIRASTPVLSPQLLQYFSSHASSPSSSSSSEITSNAEAEWVGKTPIGLKQVVHMTLGVESRNQAIQVHVAAILDLFVVGHSIIKMKKEDSVLSSSTTTAKSTAHTFANAIHDVVRVIAIWQLCTSRSNAGHSSQASQIILRQLISPPKGNFLYDPRTLCLADGLLFLGGSMKGYPHIFSFPIDALDSWSWNPAVFPNLRPIDMGVSSGGEASGGPTPVATRVVALACTLHRIRQYKYLAVALDNGDMGVMTYHPRYKKSTHPLDEISFTDKYNKEIPKSSLQLVVTLQGLTKLYSAETPHFMDEKSNQQERPVYSGCPNSYCTQLTWMAPGPSSNNLPILAAAFPNGVFIYVVSPRFAVECKVVIESANLMTVAKANKESTKLVSPFRKKKTSNPDPTSNVHPAEISSKMQALYPICMSRIFGGLDNTSTHSSHIAWLDIGSRFPPCLGILAMDQSNASHLIFTSLNVNHVSKPNRLQKLCSVPLGATEQNCTGLLTSTTLCSFLKVTGNSILAFTPILKLGVPSPSLPSRGPDPFFMHYTQPVSSPALGINSKGDVIEDSTEDFVLHIFSSINCAKEVAASEARLYMKHFLCMTTVGDRKSLLIDKASSLSNYTTANSMESFEGAHCRVIQDLSCHNVNAHLRPDRISISRHWAAVLFSNAFSESAESSKSMVSLIPSYIGIFNIPEINSKLVSDEFELYEGRDISFFSSDNKSTAFIINPSGQYIDQMTFADNRWIRSRSFTAASLGSFSFNRIHILNTGKAVCSGQDESGHLSLYSIGSCKVSDNGVGFDIFLVKKLYDVIPLDAQEQIVQFVEVKEKHALQDGNSIFIASTRFQTLIIKVVHGRMLQLLSKIRTPSRGSLAPIGNYCIAHLSATTIPNHVRLDYVSHLKGPGSRGTIAIIPTSESDEFISLLALRPDRFLYLNSHAFSRLSHDSENDSLNQVPIPIALTRPVCPLEPLVSNYLAEISEGTPVSLSKLRDIIERLGYCDTNDNNLVESQGPFGSGISGTILSMLSRHGFSEFVQCFIRNDKVLDGVGSSKVSMSSPCIPTWTKFHNTNNAAFIGILDRSGDSRGILKSPNTLPFPSEPLSTIARLRAIGAFRNKQLSHAFALLDFAGDNSSIETIITLALSLKISREESATESNAGYSLSSKHSKRVDENARGAIENNLTEEYLTECTGFYTSSPTTTPLALLSKYLRCLKDNKKDHSELTLNSIIRNFSLSYKKGLNTLCRSRNVLSSLLQLGRINDSTHAKNSLTRDESVRNMTNSKSIWYCGPFDCKEKLLQLCRFEHWLGCRLLPLLGKEGVDALTGSGDKLLASLVLADTNSTCLQTDDNSSRDTSRDGWIDGVGEGRSDEENLTLYLRFSEGMEDNRHWTSNGLQDLSNYSNRVLIVGPSNLSLENTTSSVDEGEEGKVKMLYDVVFNGVYDQKDKSYLYIEIRRGSSLDLGIWHNSNYHQSRQRGSLEFWYFCPQGLVYDEIILARRSICHAGIGVQALMAQPKEGHLLWELVLQSNGSIEFRTKSGSLTCAANADKIKARDDIDDESEVSGSESDVSCGIYQGWNHICVTFDSRNKSESISQVSLIIKGFLMASSPVSFDLPGLGIDQNANSKNVDEILDRTFLVFGLGAHHGFRMTELRYWACERSVDDTRMMMYEYLSPAETRKKLHVKIRNKNVRPKPSVNSSLAPPRNSRVSEGPGCFNPTALIENTTTSQQSDIIQAEKKGEKTNLKDDQANEVFECASEENVDLRTALTSYNSIPRSINVNFSEELSKYIKTSIAAAIVRGPNATSHFGGNSGGFATSSLDRSRELSRNITICGTEKTVILSCDDSPTATTYPVGAAGAILWKGLDENGPEYLACYQAKDKRIIVFDLKSNTVTVELQMSLKLIFWRYLPPYAHGGNITIMLVTSSGGFHFLPLDESPRPRQAFGKDSCLQGKKVIAYEEGGSNGKDGRDMRSTIGLLLLSIQKSSFVEAHCLLLFQPSPQASVCMSPDVLGAALFLPTCFIDVKDPTLPLVVMVSISESPNFEFLVEIIALTQHSDGSLMQGSSLSKLHVPKDLKDDESFEGPSLTMGLHPTVLCLCCNDHIAFIHRSKGKLFVYKYSDSDNSLSLIVSRSFDSFVADATIRSVKNSQEEIEITMLLSGTESTKHGQLIVVQM